MLTSDRAYRSCAQDPSEPVPITCEEANDAPISLSRCHRCPVVDATRRGDGRCKLSDGCGDNPVEDRNSNEFVKHSRRAAIEKRNGDTRTSRAPGAAEHDAHASEGQEAEAVERETSVCTVVRRTMVGSLTFGRFPARGRTHSPIQTRSPRQVVRGLCQFLWREPLSRSRLLP